VNTILNYCNRVYLESILFHANKAGRTPFQVLKKSCYNIYISELLQLAEPHGPCANLLIAAASSALNAAVRSRHADRVTMMLSRGINPADMDEKGRYPIELAIELGHIDILALLVKATPKEQLGKFLHHACRVHHESALRLLLRAGADVHWKLINGWTVLHTAAYEADRPSVRLLIDNKANVCHSCLYCSITLIVQYRLI